MSNGLSVHFGVQGRISSRTPKVAHNVTNSKARILSSHICQDCFPPVVWGDSTESLCGWFLPGSAGCSVSEAGEIIFGSALTPGSPAYQCTQMDSGPSGYFT